MADMIRNLIPHINGKRRTAAACRNRYFKITTPQECRKSAVPRSRIIGDGNKHTPFTRIGANLPVYLRIVSGSDHQKRTVKV